MGILKKFKKVLNENWELVGIIPIWGTRVFPPLIVLIVPLLVLWVLGWVVAWMLRRYI